MQIVPRFGDAFLQDDLAAVKFACDPMHRHTPFGMRIFKTALDSTQSFVARKKRGVKVNRTNRIGKEGSEDTHKSRQDRQIGRICLYSLYQCGIKIFAALETLGIDNLYGNTGRFCVNNPARFGFVGNRSGNDELTVMQMLYQIGEVAPRSAKKYDNFFHGRILPNPHKKGEVTNLRYNTTIRFRGYEMQSVRFDKRRIYPSKVVCIGRNYVAHIEELGNEIPEEMIVFNKPNSAISDTLYHHLKQTRFEGEIAFLIMGGEIAGIGFGLDLTHADIQERLKAKGLPWERAKAFDTSAVLSPFVPFSGDIATLHMKLYVNDTLQQEADYSLMIYKPDTMIKEIRRFMSLKDGDIILSGTPEGVDTYRVGDLFVGQVFSGNKLLVEQRWIAKKR